MKQVLVVDDEESVRMLLRDCLELDGYDVHEAPDAAQALTWLATEVPDCIVLDVMMPGMTGVEMLGLVRRNPSTAQVPVLMLTAATDDQTTWSGWAQGASYYVPKPFDIDHLLGWVARLCGVAEQDGDDSDNAFTIDVLDESEAAARPVALVAQRSGEARTSRVDVETDLMAELSSIYEPTLTPAVGWASQTEGPQAAELLRALESGQIWVAYQPIVALGTGQVVGVEALARWSHPHRGDLTPHEFVPLAERNGMAARLDAEVLVHASQQLGDWNSLRTAAGLTSLTLAINISADRIVDETFLTHLRTTLEGHNISPAAVILELNEVALMRLLGGRSSLVRDLLELGVSIAFDDFSAAATSLSFLQRFHVDIVKVDRSLVRCLTLSGDQEGDSTVAAVISLAHRLGRAVVAEGVETDEQATRLRKLGCEYAQGYLFGFPASAAQLGARMVTAGA